LLRRVLQGAGCLGACLCLSQQLALADAILHEDGASTAVQKAAVSFQVLTDMEHKLFGHVFPKEPAEHRIDRLEAFIFGSSSEGPLSDRLNHLILTVLDAAERVPLQDPAKAAPEPVPALAESARPVIAPPPQVAPEAELPLTPMNYPRVAALERLVLGKTYPNEQVAPRVRRLETKVFHKTSDGSDLSERVEELETRLHCQSAYLLMDNPEQMALEAFSTYMNKNIQVGTAHDAIGKDSSTLLDYLESLESHVLGKVHSGEPVLERLAVMETKLFDAPDNDDAIVKRVHRLWARLYPEIDAPASPQLVADNDSGTRDGVTKKGDPLLSSFEMPMNPELEAPKSRDISVDGFQLPVNQPMDASKEMTADRKKKGSMLRKVGKVLSSTMLAGTYYYQEEDLSNY